MTGSIQERNGKYYAVLIQKDGKGKRKPNKWVFTGYTIKDKPSALKFKRKLAELVLLYPETPLLKPQTESPEVRLCDYIKDYVNAKQGKVQKTTYDIYEHMLNKHLFPYFNNSGVLLSEVKPEVIEEYYDDRIAYGLSENTVLKHHGILRPVLKKAYKKKLTKECAWELEEKPKFKKYRGEWYNSDELKELLNVSKGSSIEVPIYIGAHFGLRRSEIIGLRWDAIDFSANTLTVKFKVTRAKVDGKLVTVFSDDLKSDSSHRVLPLDEEQSNYLKRIKEKQDDNRKRNGNSHNHDYNSFVCVNELGNLLNPDYISDTFKKVLKKNKLKHIRFHDLRHSCASLLLAIGYTIKDLQEWLGHANYQTTADLYSHLDPKNKKKMIKGISDALR